MTMERPRLVRDVHFVLLRARGSREDDVMSERKRSGKARRTSGELAALDEAQARGGPDRAVDGIDKRTSGVNPDSAVDTQPHPDLDGLGGSEQGGLAGAVGYFEGEGNEGAVAPLGGATDKSAVDGEGNSQGGVASGAPSG